MSMTALQSEIYQKYRQQLRAQNKRHRYGTHAAERRQQARVAIVEQYGIPFAEVKHIVALGDETTGLSRKQGEPGGWTYDNINEDIEVVRVPLSEVQLGDRIMYATGTDARVIGIKGLYFTFFGKHHNHRGTERWSIQLEADMTLPVVQNRPRRLPGAVLSSGKLS